jgi:hypothetical protein
MRPAETGQRLLTLAEFFETDVLADVTGARCREYVKWRTAQPIKSFTKNNPRLASTAAARRELEDLRAAINHHRREGLCSEIVSVVLPEKSEGRDVFLTRLQAARLLWAAWRAKQVMSDKVAARNTLRHIALGTAGHCQKFHYRVERQIRALNPQGLRRSRKSSWAADYWARKGYAAYLAAHSGDLGDAERR